MARGARVLAGRLAVIEAGAAGRLVIGTPVGHFPRKAYEGGGILAPIEREKFVAFVAATLSYYKENPRDYRVKRLAIQQAARKFDWQHSIQEWIDQIEAGARGAEGRHTTSSARIECVAPQGRDVNVRAKNAWFTNGERPRQI